MPNDESDGSDLKGLNLYGQYKASIAAFDLPDGSARNYLLAARTTAELFCLHMYEYGPVGRHEKRELSHLENRGCKALIEQAKKDGVIPEHVAALLSSIRHNGNLGHGKLIPDAALRPNTIVCRTALDTAMAWLAHDESCPVPFEVPEDPSESQDEEPPRFGGEVHLEPWYALSGSLTRADAVLVVAMCIPVIAAVLGVAVAGWYFGSIGVAAGIAAVVALVIAAFIRLVFKPARNEVKVSLAGCRRITAEQPDQKIRIDPRIGWTATPIVLEGGVLYQFVTEGKVAHSAYSGWHDANGNAAPLSKRFSKLPGAKHFNVSSLIGRMGKDGAPFLVGAQSLHRFDVEQQLQLAINDWPRFDNKGEFVLTIGMADDDPSDDGEPSTDDTEWE